MSDDRKEVGSPDRDRINLSEDYEVRYWTEALSVSEQQLREAVAAVGSTADAVRRHLGR
ncbi:DUF3606 domain-containing protein [Pseudoxanthomonas sp. J31]|uniref:DUF3606 domain-containing protein n=1 Tax=Pseudoxanthomonas sp. J31 TaxID=935851 RepID=UPI0003F93E6F|nr:DUF3606 domain-containing protein [Pseudoxanthomonas sp. J31]